MSYKKCAGCGTSRSEFRMEYGAGNWYCVDEDGHGRRIARCAPKTTGR